MANSSVDSCNADDQFLKARQCAGLVAFVVLALTGPHSADFSELWLS